MKINFFIEIQNSQACLLLDYYIKQMRETIAITCT
jgi:hypothetical protein